MAGYTFYVAPRTAGAPRLGNRIKRCIREAFRLEQENLRAMDILVRPPLDIRPCAQMICRLRELLSKLGR